LNKKRDHSEIHWKLEYDFFMTLWEIDELCEKSLFPLLWVCSILFWTYFVRKWMSLKNEFYSAELFFFDEKENWNQKSIFGLPKYNHDQEITNKSKQKINIIWESGFLK
jgi:hypothetical protein